MLDIPHEVVEYVSWLIYARRRELRSRWRRLSCFRQAVLVLVHLLCPGGSTTSRPLALTE